MLDKRLKYTCYHGYYDIKTRHKSAGLEPFRTVANNDSAIGNTGKYTKENVELFEERPVCYVVKAT